MLSQENPTPLSNQPGASDAVTNQVPKPSRKGTKRSWLWTENHFTPGKDEAGNDIGICAYCKRGFVADGNRDGTSGLGKHLARCKMYPPNMEVKQARIALQRNEQGKGTVVTWNFDQDLVRTALTRMIIIDELPFRFVEGEGFRQFIAVACPNFKIPSRQTVGRDCTKLYNSEIENMKKFFKSSCQRVCLTSDTWTSNQRINYMAITVHFIDDDWKLHKRIVNFCPITSHKGEAMSSAIENCLRAWELDEKVFTITLDNASSNDSTISSFKRKISNLGSTILNGDFIHIRCVAHIINIAVNDGLGGIASSIEKVRNVVRYVRQSPARLTMFKQCAKLAKITSKKSLCLDVPTRWNSTYLMLDVAQTYERAFDRLEELVPSYKYDFEETILDPIQQVKKIDHRPSRKDWDKCREFAKLLQHFYDLTLKISGSLYVTSNNILQEIYAVYSLLKEWESSEDDKLKNMGIKMKEKFDKYWGDQVKMNSLLYIAMVLDPRFKLDFVQFMLREMHGEYMGTKVGEKLRNTLVLLFNDYKAKKEGKSDGGNLQSDNDIMVVDENINRKESKTQLLFAKFQKEKLEKGGLGSGSGSELDKYLTETVEDASKDLDILGWWKQNSHSHRFPILSCMARDVLAIPVSTVASESAFSTGGRVLDSFRSSLTPKVVECLICTQDWIRASKNKPINLEEHLEEVEEIEQGMTNITVEDLSEVERH